MFFAGTTQYQYFLSAFAHLAGAVEYTDNISAEE